MEFAEITKDPFTNNTNNYFLVLDIASESIGNPSSPGRSGTRNGQLSDPSGSPVGYFFWNAYQDYEVTGSLSNEAYSHSYAYRKEWVLVPPKYTFSIFIACIGFWLSPKEVEQFILGRLSLKGGD